MDENKCLDFKHPTTAAAHCQTNDQESKSKFIDCMHHLFFTHFKRIFWRNTVSSPLYTADEQLTHAFFEGTELFYMRLRDFGWEERGGTLRTALFNYCFNKLRELTKKILRDNKQKLILMAQAGSYTTSIAFGEVNEMRKRQEEIFRRAFSQLGDECRDFILWRKADAIADEEIEQKYPDKFGKRRDPDDLVHRCWKRLKKLVDKQKRS